MPQPRQVIRKVERTGLADFDDQMWPINCALIVLAGFVAGIIIAHSDFDTPRLLYNGWARLASLAVVVSLAAWGMIKLQGKWTRRMQLAVLLSLLVHLWLGMYLKEAYLAMVLEMESRAQEAVEEQQIVTTYDYDFQTPDQIVPDETLSEPVETTTPDVQPREVTRRELVSVPTEVQPADEPARTEFERPIPAELERAEVSAPRRSEAPAGPQLSRADVDRELATPSTELPEIETAPRPEPAGRQVEAKPLEPTRARSEAARRDEPTRIPDSPTQQARPEIQRRPTENLPRRQTETNPTAARRLAAVSPRFDAQSPLPDLDSTASAQPAPRAEAAVAQIERAAAAAALRAPAETSQLPTTSSPTTDVRQPDAVRPTQRPELTASPAALATRKLRSADLPTDAPAESPLTQSSSFAPAVTRPLEAAVADLARGRTADAPSAALPLPATSGAAASTPQSAPALNQPRRAENSGQPSVAAAGAAPAQLARTQGRVEAAEFPANANLPSPGAAQSADNSPAEPPRTGLTRATAGTEGLTRQRSFDLELPAAGRQINVPTAAARRAQAADQPHAPDAADPSRPAQIARARAGAEIPSATLLATDAPAADAAGSSRPAEVEASSSAAVERVAASAPSAPVTASAGGATIDFGAPQANAGTLHNRAAGGGEPTVSTQALPTRLARAGRAGGAAAEIPLPAENPTENLAGTSPGGANTTALESQAAAVDRGAAATPATRLTSGPAEPQTTGGGADVAVGSLVRASGAQTQPADSSRQPSAALTTRQLARADVAGSAADVDNPAAGQSSDTDNSDVPPADANVTGISRNASSPAGTLARPTSGGETLAGAQTAPAVSSIAAAGPSRPATGPEAAPSISGDAVAAAPLRRAGPAGLPTGAAVADAPGAESLAASGDTESLGADGPSDGSGSISRRRTGPAVRIAAEAGPGGLTTAPAAAPGLPSRRARPESDVVHSALQRFVMQRAGGTPIAIDAEALTGPVAGFRQREREQREELLRKHGGTEGSERAVEMGLDFLARHQLPDGRWSLHNFAAARAGYSNNGAGDMQADTAATGLALLSFFGAGYTHTEGKYRPVVRRGLDHLLARQKPDGDLFVPQDAVSARNVWLYSHGIASIALCEAYGMTRDPQLRDSAQRALDFIVAAQHETLGGWRYSPRAGSDTSVSGWQVMALKSGQLAGLEVPADTYAGVLRWLEHAQGPAGNPAYYAYRPRSNQRSQNQPSRAMTAEALLMRQYLGWNRENPHLVRGADYLKLNLPTYGSRSSRDRDAYYWYYATQVMFQMQGPHWQAWNDALRPLLERTQAESGQFAGSWDPAGPVPDRWGGRAGRIYITCLHLLMLEVYYRHLPLYQDLN